MLTPLQLSAIDNHLRKENWLLNNDLIAELTDHYAVGIEDRLDKGMAFDAAIREIHTGFGGRKGLLKMEEEYQTQKFRQRGLIEWQLIRSFVSGSRLPISISIFASLYLLNTYTGQQETVESALGTGFFFVTGSVLTNVVLVIFSFYQHRREANYAVIQPTSSVYIIAYCLSLSLLIMNKYLFIKYGLDLPTLILTSLETLLETLCLIYYMVMILSIRQTLLNSRKNHPKNIT